MYAGIFTISTDDYEDLFRSLYESASKYMPGKEGTVAMLVNDHQYKANFRIDKEINIMSLINNLILQKWMDKQEEQILNKDHKCK